MVMKIVVTPTVSEYNLGAKRRLAEPSLKGSFVPDAQRTEKNPNCRRGQAPYPLWRNHPDSLVLQKAAAEVASSEESFLCPTLWAVSSRRTYPGHHLCS